MCETDLRLPVSQYGANSLLKRFIDSFTNRVCESRSDIETFYKFFNIDEATGTWLDRIGDIVGQPRVAYDGANQNWFAMDAPDPITSGFNVGKFWNGNEYESGQIVVDDILYRQLIKARIINNYSRSTINDALEVIQLVLGRTDANIVDGGCGDSGLITPNNMEFVVEFTNPITEDERSLILDLGLLPKTAGVNLLAVVP